MNIHPVKANATYMITIVSFFSGIQCFRQIIPLSPSSFDLVSLLNFDIPTSNQVHHDIPRHFLVTSLEPLAKGFTRELTEKLGRPVSIDLSPIRTSDIAQIYNPQAREEGED